MTMSLRVAATARKGSLSLKRVLAIVLGLALAALCAAPARSQVQPDPQVQTQAPAQPPSRSLSQWAVYGQGTGGTLQFENTADMPGATFGFYNVKPSGPVSVGMDFRGEILRRAGTQGPFSDQVFESGQFGLRAAASPKVLPHSLTPYVEGTLGVAYWRGGVGVTRQEASHFTIQVVTGLDFPIAHHFEWRVIEFTYGRAGAMPGFISPATLSSGIVLRLR
jgi:hypothetical protein